MAGIITGSIISAFAGNRAAGIQASAAKDAASTQAEANRYAAEIQKQMFDKQIELQAPFREAGLKGQNRLSELLGVGGDVNAPGYGKYASAEFGGVKGFDPASLMNEFGGIKGFDPASLTRNFSQADFQTDPGYAFRMSEGMKALDRSAAARGGLLSGATLKGAQRFGQDLGSQEYQNAFARFQANRAVQGQEYTNAFNRFQANRAAKSGEFQNAFDRFQLERTGTLNPYSSLAGVAQSSANTLGTAARNYGVSAGNLASDTGGAYGNAILTGGNASANAISGYGNALGQAFGGGGRSAYGNTNFGDRMSNYYGTNQSNAQQNEISRLGSNTYNPFSDYNTGANGFGSYGE